MMIGKEKRVAKKNLPIKKLLGVRPASKPFLTMGRAKPQTNVLPKSAR